MGNTFVISDPHFGHGNILKFTNSDGSRVRTFSSVEEMDETMIQNWNNTVTPSDKVYCLGDVAINKKFISQVGRLNGDKVLIKGNHDIFSLEYYTEYFRDIRAYQVFPKDKMILSHIPIHTESLERFVCNIHGHLHCNKVKDKFGKDDIRYINVCVENINYTPISLDEIRSEMKNRGLI